GSLSNSHRRRAGSLFSLALLFFFNGDPLHAETVTGRIMDFATVSEEVPYQIEYQREYFGRSAYEGQSAEVKQQVQNLYLEAPIAEGGNNTWVLDSRIHHRSLRGS